MQLDIAAPLLRRWWSASPDSRIIEQPIYPALAHRCPLLALQPPHSFMSRIELQLEATTNVGRGGGMLTPHASDQADEEVMLRVLSSLISLAKPQAHLLPTRTSKLRIVAVRNDNAQQISQRWGINTR